MRTRSLVKATVSRAENVDLVRRLLDEHEDLEALEEPPEIGLFPVVRTRFENAKEIIRKGRYSSKLDPAGPEPPLQMPAWQHIVRDREIDALLVYFVSLYPWEEG